MLSRLPTHVIKHIIAEIAMRYPCFRPVQRKDFILPFLKNSLIPDFASPVRLIRYLVDEIEHAAFTDCHDCVVEVLDCSWKAEWIFLDPMVERKTEARELERLSGQFAVRP